MIKSIKTKTTTKYSNDSNFKERMKQIIADSKDSYVTIGFHEDAGKYTQGANPPEVVEVALWNEFGTKHSPERSFIRTAIDEGADQIQKWSNEALANMMTKGWDLHKALDYVGFNIVVLIQNKIKSNVPPPNAKSTLEQKSKDGVGSNTLMHTQLMLRSVKHKVVINGHSGNVDWLYKL